MTQTKNILDQVEVFLSAQYEFRRNVVKDKTEYRLAGSQDRFKQVGDYFLNSLKRSLKANGIHAGKSELTGLLNSHFVPQVDVFKVYFENLCTPFTLLPEREISVSQIDRLADSVTTTNQPLWRKYFRKWLVATIGCAIDPEVVNHQILILTGKQGIGKSHWLQRLLPLHLKDYMYSGHISAGNKDTLTMLAENLFINLDELGGFSSSDIDSMKELITKAVIQFRRPYAVYTENYVRRASFMASVNHVTFLNDLTGNRRFLPFTATAIDYQHTINIDDVYAEAYQLYKEGFKYWFDPSDIAEIEANNAQYVEISMEQELVEKYFVVAEEGGDDTTMTATEACKFLNVHERLPLTNASIQKVGAILRALGFKRVKRKNAYRYIVKFVTPESQAA